MKTKSISTQYQVLIATSVLISTYVGLFYVGYHNAAAVFWPAAGFSAGFFYLYRKEVLPTIIISLIAANLSYRLFLVEESVWLSLLLSNQN